MSEEEKPLPNDQLFNVWRKNRETGKWTRIPDSEVREMFGGKPPVEFTDPGYRQF